MSDCFIGSIFLFSVTTLAAHLIIYFFAKVITLERSRFTFTPNARREFVPSDQVFLLFSVYSLLLLHKNK